MLKSNYIITGNNFILGLAGCGGEQQGAEEPSGDD